MSNSPENWISEVSVVEGLENIYSLPPEPISEFSPPLRCTVRRAFK